MSGRINCLDKAKGIVAGNRDRRYGAPEENFEKIAELWNAYVGEKLFDANDVAMMMTLLKIARIKSAVGYSEDSYVDIAGYAACGSEIAEKRKAVVMDCPSRGASSIDIAEVIVNEERTDH